MYRVVFSFVMPHVKLSLVKCKLNLPSLYELELCMRKYSIRCKMYDEYIPLPYTGRYLLVWDRRLSDILHKSKRRNNFPTFHDNWITLQHWCFLWHASVSNAISGEICSKWVLRVSASCILNHWSEYPMGSMPTPWLIMPWHFAS